MLFDGIWEICTQWLSDKCTCGDQDTFIVHTHQFMPLSPFSMQIQHEAMKDILSLQNKFEDMMFRKVHTENMCRQVVKSSSFTQMHSANRMAVLHTILMWNNIYLPYTLLLTPKMSTTKRWSFITFQYHKHILPLYSIYTKQTF